MAARSISSSRKRASRNFSRTRLTPRWNSASSSRTTSRSGFRSTRISRTSGSTRSCRTPRRNDGSAPDLLAAAGQPELAPHRVDLVDHRLVHADLAAPFAGGLARPLVRGIEADLGAEATDRAREVEIVDRRVLDHRD